jgi:hypothetical protein
MIRLRAVGNEQAHARSLSAPFTGWRVTSRRERASTWSRERLTAGRSGLVACELRAFEAFRSADKSAAIFAARVERGCGGSRESASAAGEARSRRVFSTHDTTMSRNIVSYDDIAPPAPPPPAAPPAVSAGVEHANKRRKQNNRQSNGGGRHAQHWDDPSVPAQPPPAAGPSMHQSTAKAPRAPVPEEESRELTHEEIWDDSALVDAWDAAQEEYHASVLPDLRSLSNEYSGIEWPRQGLEKGPRAQVRSVRRASLLTRRPSHDPV